jgi:hypothetical protein
MCGGGSRPSAPKPPPDPRLEVKDYKQVAKDIGISNFNSQADIIKVEREMAARETARIEQRYDDQRAADQARMDTLMAQQRTDQERMLGEQRATQQAQMQEYRASSAAAAAAEQDRYEQARAEAQARADEQRRIAQAPPAPPPNPSVTDVKTSLEIAPLARITGRGRRRFRTGGAAAAPVATSLSIPGVRS